MPAFDKEMWGIVRDEEQRTYCDVFDNTVQVLPQRKREYSAQIKVPSDLFSFIRSVLGVSIESARATPLSFYLEEGGGVWFFGIYLPDDSIDLWTYRELPAWAWRIK